MEAGFPVCPDGLFPNPREYSIFEVSNPKALHGDLLGQLQDFHERTTKLLNVLSIPGHKEAGAHMLELTTLFADGLEFIQQAVVAATAVKSPLLTSSSKHAKCFCRLLEQLNLLELVSHHNQHTARLEHSELTSKVQQQTWQKSMATAAGGQTRAAEAIPAVPAEQRMTALGSADAVCDRGCSNDSSFIYQLEQLLWKIPGAAAVFAALIAHCQHSIDAGNGVNGSSNSAAAKHGTVDASCLSSSQELHSAARSLPLLLRLYFTSDSRAEALAQGKSEPLSNKMLERCLASLADCPVVPGQGNVVVCVLDLLSNCQDFQEVLVARKLKLPPGLQHLDDKAWAKLDQNYSLNSKTVSFLQQHDELCDLLSQLALEVKQALAVDRDIDSTAFCKAETLVIGSLNFISSARNALMELDAWRLASSRLADTMGLTAAGGSAVPAPGTTLPADRYHLADMDTVPFIDILAAVASLVGLMADCEAWLQPLLHEHAVKQLQDIAVHSLPLLAKTYPKNQRIQQLLKHMIDCLQGNLVELSTGRDAVGVAAATHAAPAETQDSVPQLAARGPGPIAEGFEGLVSPVKAVWGKREKPRASSRQEQRKQPPVAGVSSHQAASASTGFGLEAEVDAAEAVVAVAIDGSLQNSNGAAGHRGLDEPAVVQEGSSGQAASSPHSEEPARARKTWVKAIMRSMGSKQAKATGMNKHNSLLLEELEQLEAEVTGAAEPAIEEQPAQCLLLPLSEARPASPGAEAEPAARCESPQSGAALLGKMQQQPCQAADGPPLLQTLFAAGSGHAPRGAVEQSSAEKMTTRSQEQLCQPSDDSNDAAAAGALAPEDADPGSSSLKIDSITNNHDVNQAAALGGSRSQNASLANELTSLQTCDHSESITAADKPEQPAASTGSSRAAEGVDGSRTLGGPGEAGASDSELRLELNQRGCTAPETPRSQQRRLLHLGKLLLQPNRLMMRSTASAQETAAVGSEQEQPAFQLTPRRNSAGLLQQPQLHGRDTGNGKSASFIAHQSAGNSFLQRIHSKARQQQDIQQQQQPQLVEHVSSGKGPDPQPAATVMKPTSVLAAFRRHPAAAAVVASEGAEVVAEAAAAAAAVTHEPAAAKRTALETASDVPADTAAETSAGSDLACLLRPEAADVADVPAAGDGSFHPGDQRGKSSRPSTFVSRMMSFRSTTAREHQEQAAEPQTPAAGSLAGSLAGRSARQLLTGLGLTSKFRQAATDKRKGRRWWEAGHDDQLPVLQRLPSAACILQLGVLLDQLLLEVKGETKRHLVNQLQLAAAAAVGSAAIKPDASIARPLQQVKTVMKIVKALQLTTDFTRQLLLAADLSGLWFSPVSGSCDIPAAGSASSDVAGINAEYQQLPCSVLGTMPQHNKRLDVVQQGQQPAERFNLLNNSLFEHPASTATALPAVSAQEALPAAEEAATVAADKQVDDQNKAHQCSSSIRLCNGEVAMQSSFPASLMLRCMDQLNSMPAELPLLALQVFWDARNTLKSCGVLELGLPLLRLQEEAFMQSYMQHLVPTMYEHYKTIAAHQTATHELLQSCGAAALAPVQPLYCDSLLQDPCLIVLLGDYSDVAAAVHTQLGSGSMLAQDAEEGMPEQPAAAQPRAQEHHVLNQLQQMLQDLQHPGAEKPEQPARQAHDDQQFACHVMAGSKGPPPLLMSSTLSKSPLRRRHKRRVIPASTAPSDVTGAAEEPGQTPLVQKMERSRGLQAELRGWQQQQLASFVCSCNCMLVDLRQWLSAGLVTALHQDAALLVQRSRCLPANGIVELGVHYAILQRTHQLLWQYMLLPDSWIEVWEAADAEHTGGMISTSDDVTSCSAKAVVGSIMDILDTAAYDSEAQVLMLGKENGTAAAALAGHPKLTGVLAQVASVLQPFRNFFGRQHLASMHAFAGPAGQQLLLSCLLNKLDNQQAVLLEHLLLLQQHLPPALLQLPPADVYHDAGMVLRYYQQHLSAALSQPGLCAKALQTLQCIGNCFALLQLLSIQQATAATPLFMQVAPLLGIVGRSISDAAAVADCIERSGPPDPISAIAAAASGSWSWTRSCAAGLLMPETEALEPSDRARHAHEMQALRELQQEQAWRLEAHAQGQPFDENLTKPGGELARHRIWQASHFQRLVLGPDADKLRGPAVLLTINAEFRAWQATQGADLMQPCMDKVKAWAEQLQQQLLQAQDPQEAAADKAAAVNSSKRIQSSRAAEGQGMTPVAESIPVTPPALSNQAHVKVSHARQQAAADNTCSAGSPALAGGGLPSAAKTHPAEGSAKDAFVWYGGCGGQDTPPGLRLESANASPHPTADALGRATAGVQAAKHCRQALPPVADISADAVGNGGQEQESQPGMACQVVPEEPPQQHVQQATAEPSTEFSQSVSSLDLVMTSEDDLTEESEALSAGAAAAAGGAVVEAAAADGNGARPTVVPRLGLLQDTACEALVAACDVQAVSGGAPTRTPAASAPQANAVGDSTIAGSSEEGLHADALTMFMSGRSEFTFSSDDPDGGAPCISRSGTVPGMAVQCSAYAAAPGPGDLLFDSTCHELVRVIDERNKLQSEVVMLRNQLKNRDSSLALLKGTLLTPRRRSMEDGEGYETPALGSAVASAEPSCGGASTVAGIAYPSCAGMSPAASAVPSAEPSKADEPSTTHTSATVQAGCVAGAIGPSSTPAAGQDAGSVGLQSCSAAMAAVTIDQQEQQQARGCAVDELGPAAPSHQEQADIEQLNSGSRISCNGSSSSNSEEDNGSASLHAASSLEEQDSLHSLTEQCRLQAASRKLRMPAVAKANGSAKRQSQLAVALSALKFALLMEIASKGAAAAGSAAASGGNENADDVQLSSAVNPRDVNTAHAASPHAGTPTGDCPAAAGIASLHASVAAGIQDSGNVMHRVTGGSGSGAGGKYGDGPLLASAVLLQLTGQARLHSLVDATQRIAYWVEYCAFRHNGQAQISCAGSSKAPRTATTLPGLGSPPGGIGPAAADGIAAPKPRSRRRQVQEAEAEERQAHQAAAQQHLLERLATANRQAENIAADGFSMAARFAPPVPARSQAVRLKVYRVDKAAAAGSGAEAAAVGSQVAGSGEGSRLGRWPSEAAGFSSSGGGRAPPSSLGGMSSSTAGCGAGKVRVEAVPVKGALRAFSPAARPWDGIVPCSAAMQAHPALPMKRPLPLLLPASSRAAGIGDMPALEGAAAGGVLNGAGRLLPGAGVAARGGVVAAARAVHAKEALLASVPKHAAYSFSVVSDHNRSGLMEDGYSKAPSTTDLDNYQEDVHQLLGNRRSGTAAAAASAARLGARKAASDLLELQRQAGSGLSDLPLRSTSPSKSPGRKQQHTQQGGAHAGPPGGTRGLLVRAATVAGLVPS